MPFSDLVDHIQRLHHFSSYTRYEIDQSLLHLGFDPVEIEEAWEAIYFPPKPVRLISSLRFWLVFLEYLVGIIFIIFLLNFLFPGTGAGGAVACGLWIVSSISAKFIEKWDKVVSRGLLYGSVALGCGMSGMVFLWFYLMVTTLASCRGSCYP